MKIFINMKHFTKSFLFGLIALLCSVSASAYDFEVDGIYYDILSHEDLTVEVTEGDNKYTGDVVIPSTVTYKSRTLSVTSIVSSAFSGCSSLTSIEIPNSVTSIVSSAFSGCSSLTSIEIPNSVTSIGNSAFSGCSSLKDLHIEDGTTALSLGYNSRYEGLFYDCPLVSLHLGRNLSYNTDYSYGDSPFARIKSLITVTIGDSVTSIGSYAFNGCSSLTSIEIPNSVTSIGSYAFNACSSLTSIEIPNSVTSISYNAFSYCSNLTSIEIGNSVTSIGEGAFGNCSNLTSVEIGNSVTSIREYAFYNCSSLSSIYMLGTTPPSVGSNNFTNRQYLEVFLYVPNGYLAEYQSAEPWKNFWEIKEYDATGIDDISADNMEIKFTGNGISLPNAVDKAVYVYSVNGAVVEKFSHYDGGEILLGKGTYIIRIGEKAIKVQL